VNISAVIVIVPSVIFLLASALHAYARWTIRDLDRERIEPDPVSTEHSESKRAGHE
jgi:hypothetical protein